MILTTSRHQVRFVILPIVGVAGRLRLEGGDACARKNAHGVDLNRNWPLGWKRVPNRHDEEFGGDAPLSEVESQAVRTQAPTGESRAGVQGGETSDGGGWPPGEEPWVASWAHDPGAWWML